MNSTFKVDKNLEQISQMAKELSIKDDSETIRFNVCDTGLYKWASVKTNSLRISRFLVACWNNRAAIAEMIDAQKDFSNGDSE